MFEQAEGRSHTLAGEGRADSPGHSAKYGTYTILDVERNKVLHVETVQVLNKSSKPASRNYEIGEVWKKSYTNLEV